MKKYGLPRIERLFFPNAKKVDDNNRVKYTVKVDKIKALLTSILLLYF